ncbi:MAG: hypothetical protein QM660_13670 [Dysgonomonas sp.]
MKKTITTKQHGNLDEKEELVVVPSSRTLDFLRAFARSYYVEKTLPTSLNEVCVN